MDADTTEDTQDLTHMELTQQVIEAIRVAYERENPNPKATERYGGRPGWGRLGVHLHETAENLSTFASGNRTPSFQKLVNWILRHNRRMPAHPVTLQIHGTRIIVYVDEPTPRWLDA